MSNEQTTAVSTRADTAVMGFDDPQGFTHIQRVAKVFSASALVPDQFRGEQNVANCVIALDMAKRLGANPLAVMQHLYIVHGKPGWSSQWIIGAINTCGRFEPLRFDVTGTGDNKTCVAWTLDKGMRLPEGVRTLAQTKEYEVAIYESPPVSIAMAKAEGWFGKNGSKWKTMEDLMLRYRAATFFGRLYAPEILMGMSSVEELADIDGNGSVPKQTLNDAPPPMKRATVVEAPPPPVVKTSAPPPAANAGRPTTPTTTATDRRGTPSPQPAEQSAAEERELGELGLAPTKESSGPSLTECQQQLLENVKSADASFEEFRAWGRKEFGDGDPSTTGLLAWDAMAGFEDVPEKFCRLLNKSAKAMVAALKAEKGAAQ